MNYTQKNKLSKKAQRKINQKQRNMWTISPITRVVPSKKVYHRKKFKSFDIDE